MVIARGTLQLLVHNFEACFYVTFASESIQISCTASVSHFPSTKDVENTFPKARRGQSEGSAPNVIGFGTSHTDNIRKTRFL